MISLLELCLKTVFSEPLSVSDNIPFFNSLVKKKLLMSKVINKQLYFYLRIKATKTDKKNSSKFRSPVLSTVSYSRELLDLQSEYSRLLMCTKISNGGDEELKELILKWKSACIVLISDLRDMIGQVVISDITRSLTLLELANSLKFDISIIGNYDESNDEFY
jgi:hypothetical protein